MDGNVVHPHPGVVPGGIPGVVHGMAVHGAGPDGEHAPHGPRRRYQNRPKPPSNLERLPLDEAAKRVPNFHFRFLVTLIILTKL